MCASTVLAPNDDCIPSTCHSKDHACIDRLSETLDRAVSYSPLELIFRY